jgi:hypothetical protein
MTLPTGRTIRRLERDAGIKTEPPRCRCGCAKVTITLDWVWGTSEPGWQCPECGGDPMLLIVVRRPPVTAEQWLSAEACEAFGEDYARRMVERLQEPEADPAPGRLGHKGD